MTMPHKKIPSFVAGSGMGDIPSGIPNPHDPKWQQLLFALLQVVSSQMAPQAGGSMDKEESENEEAAEEAINLCLENNDKVENVKNQKIKNQKNKSIHMNVEKNDNQKPKDMVEDDKGCKVYHQYNPATEASLPSILKAKAFHEGGKYPDDKDDVEDEEEEENEEFENPGEDEVEKEDMKDEEDEDDEIDKLLVSRSIQEVPLEEYFTFWQVTLGNGNVVFMSQFNESFRCDVCSRKTKN